MKKKLLLSLIKDDLINSKLVSGLNELGLNAENYYLHLSETIFQLMGFIATKQDEKIYDHYIQLTQKARHLDISQSHLALDQLALTIYKKLRAKKKASSTKIPTTKKKRLNSAI